MNREMDDKANPEAKTAGGFRRLIGRITEFFAFVFQSRPITTRTVFTVFALFLVGVGFGVAAVQIAPGVEHQSPRALRVDPVVRVQGPTEETVATTLGPTTEGIKELIAKLPQDSRAAFTEFGMATYHESPGYLETKWDLSRRYLKTGELVGNATIGFLLAPREEFCRSFNIDKAYDDTWLPVGYGATITDPDVVCMMTTTLDLQPGQKVLEIGTGSGYQSSILSFMTDQVYSIEIIEPLYRETNALYEKLSSRFPTFKNIRRKLGDGFFGWQKYAPFDRIIVTCAIDHVPPPLLQQLTPGGVMVVPLGPPGQQYIMEIRKVVDEQGNVSLKRRDVYSGAYVKFIPFRDDAGKSYTADGSADKTDK